MEDIKRAQSLLSTEKHMLEVIASGANLKEILVKLCSRFDAQSSNFISTILLMDPAGERLRLGQVPEFPKSGPRL
jgi:hypothetical protein